jgi:hypothetical protein
MNIGNKMIGEIVEMITDTIFNHTANVTCVDIVKRLESA